MEQRIAIFPGSFDPFTVGHHSIVMRALPLFDKIVVAIGTNAAKYAMMSESRRVEALRELYADNEKIEVISYEGLTVDAAKMCGAKFILRGVRMIQDFEYEKNLAEVNRSISGLETVLLYTLPEFVHISSSIVREFIRYGSDVSSFLSDGYKL